MLENAKGPHAWAAVAAFAFAEASFFPIPADVMVLPMMLADRSASSGWAPGWPSGRWPAACWAMPSAHLFWETAGLWLIHALHVPLEQVEALRFKYTQHAYLIMVQGATPIPYKLVTIASGLAGVSFPLFMLYSTITRSIRYIVIEGLLVYFFGERAQILLEKYLELALIVFLIVLVLGFVALLTTFISADHALSLVPVRWILSSRPTRAGLRLRPARPAASPAAYHHGPPASGSPVVSAIDFSDAPLLAARFCGALHAGAGAADGQVQLQLRSTGPGSPGPPP